MASYPAPDPLQSLAFRKAPSKNVETVNSLALAEDSEMERKSSILAEAISYREVYEATIRSEREAWRKERREEKEESQKALDNLAHQLTQQTARAKIANMLIKQLREKEASRLAGEEAIEAKRREDMTTLRVTMERAKRSDELRKQAQHELVLLEANSQKLRRASQEEKEARLREANDLTTENALLKEALAEHKDRLCRTEAELAELRDGAPERARRDGQALFATRLRDMNLTILTANEGRRQLEARLEARVQALDEEHARLQGEADARAQAAIDRDRKDLDKRIKASKEIQAKRDAELKATALELVRLKEEADRVRKQSVAAAAQERDLALRDVEDLHAKAKRHEKAAAAHEAMANSKRRELEQQCAHNAAVGADAQAALERHLAAEQSFVEGRAQCEKTIRVVQDQLKTRIGGQECEVCYEVRYCFNWMAQCSKKHVRTCDRCVDQLKAKGPKHELCNVCSRYDPGNKEGFIQISNVLRDPEPAARPPEL